MEQSCNLPCYEGCSCNSGYVLSGTTCVTVENCGCNDINGNYHLADSTWVNEDCSMVSICRNGTITLGPIACTENAICAVRSATSGCYCLHGFQGHGEFNCEDINECNISGSCIHGTCLNSIGSYTCICDHNWTGARCNIYINYCKGVLCQNGGQCMDTGAGFLCF